MGQLAAYKYQCHRQVVQIKAICCLGQVVEMVALMDLAVGQRLARPMAA